MRKIQHDETNEIYVEYADEENPDDETDAEADDERVRNEENDERQEKGREGF